MGDRRAAGQRRTGPRTRKPLREVVRRLWRWSRQNPTQRRAARKRARFWAELREGEREADSRSHP